MDNLKFKAWVFSKNKMYRVTGFCFDDPVGDVEVFDEEVNDYRCYNSKKKECVVLQCTGYQDKNSDDIYFGDIVKCDYNAPVLLVESTGFYWHINELCAPDLMEIIGNKFENEDLLKRIKGE